MSSVFVAPADHFLFMLFTIKCIMSLSLQTSSVCIRGGFPYIPSVYYQVVTSTCSNWMNLYNRWPLSRLYDVIFTIAVCDFGMSITDRAKYMLARTWRSFPHSWTHRCWNPKLLECISCILHLNEGHNIFNNLGFAERCLLVAIVGLL